MVFFPLRLWCRQDGLGNVLPMGMDESLVFVLFCFTVFKEPLISVRMCAMKTVNVYSLYLLGINVDM